MSVERWRPSPVTLVSGVLVLAGFLLAGVSWWFFALVAIGAFGPGLLRELGWLEDQDELQRQAAHQAGYHAFLATGAAAVALIATVRAAEGWITDPQELPTLLLAVLWFSWFFSSLLNYWGAKQTSSKVLYAFGAVWLAFNILANTGSEWTGPVALILQSLLAVPFFALGWAAGRFPRVAGALLLAAGAFFFWFFGLFQTDNLGFATQGVVFVLFVCPLLVSGAALLLHSDDDLDDPGTGRASATPA